MGSGERALQAQNRSGDRGTEYTRNPPGPQTDRFANICVVRSTAQAGVKPSGDKHTQKGTTERPTPVFRLVLSLCWWNLSSAGSVQPKLQTAQRMSRTLHTHKKKQKLMSLNNWNERFLLSWKHISVSLKLPYVRVTHRKETIRDNIYITSDQVRATFDHNYT